MPRGAEAASPARVVEALEWGDPSPCPLPCAGRGMTDEGSALVLPRGSRVLRTSRGVAGPPTGAKVLPDTPHPCSKPRRRASDTCSVPAGARISRTAAAQTEELRRECEGRSSSRLAPLPSHPFPRREGAGGWAATRLHLDGPETRRRHTRFASPTTLDHPREAKGWAALPAKRYTGGLLTPPAPRGHLP